jgi:hypothetical protein
VHLAEAPSSLHHVQLTPSSAAAKSPLFLLLLLPPLLLLLLLLQDPPFDELAFSKGVTYDATPAAGSAPRCVQTVRRAWEVGELVTSAVCAPRPKADSALIH